MHIGEKPYECTCCDKKFLDKSALNRHLKAREKRALQRTFTCGTCGETFDNRAPYNALIRTAHQQPVAAIRKRTAQKTTDAPRKDLRGRTKQVRVPPQNQFPQQVLKTALLAGNLIYSHSSQPCSS